MNTKQETYNNISTFFNKKLYDFLDYRILINIHTTAVSHDFCLFLPTIPILKGLNQSQNFHRGFFNYGFFCIDYSYSWKWRELIRALFSNLVFHAQFSL